MRLCLSKLSKVKRSLVLLVFSLVFSCFYLSGHATTDENTLDIVVKTAPIVPHGLMTGKPLDITLSVVDLDPVVPGISMKKGGTVQVFLPPEVVNTGFPVATPSPDTEGCKPPVLERCSSGGMLFGWPQSPILPLPSISYDEGTHSLLMTSSADTPPYSIETPGVKLIHLFTFGFMNPDEAGSYPVSLEIQPDPSSDEVLKGTAQIEIMNERSPNIAIDTTQSINVKGPWFQNTMFQSLKPGHTSLNMSSNLWNAEHKPIVGAKIVMSNNQEGDLVSEEGEVIGGLNIQAPAEANGYYLLTAPSFETKTGLAGFPTGRIVTSLKTAPKVEGDYVVTLSLNGGDSTVHTIRVRQ